MTKKQSIAKWPNRGCLWVRRDGFGGTWTWHCEEQSSTGFFEKSTAQADAEKKFRGIDHWSEVPMISMRGTFVAVPR